MKCLIPARAGSKGIKNKNVVIFKGTPLVEYTIKLAKELCGRRNVIVSTDCPKVESVALGIEYSVEVNHRPGHLATDEANLRDVALHEVYKNDIKEDLLILLPTYPDRTTTETFKFWDFWKDNRETSDSAICYLEAEDHPSLCVDDNNKPFGKLIYRRQERKPAKRLYHKYIAVRSDRLNELDEGFFNETTALFKLDQRPKDIDTERDLCTLQKRHLNQETSEIQQLLKRSAGILGDTLLL